MVCKNCGYEMVEGLVICPNCLKNVPTYNPVKELKKSLKSGKKRGLSDEEILALGLYPKDEGYKMSLISRILGKR